MNAEQKLQALHDKAHKDPNLMTRLKTEPDKVLKEHALSFDELDTVVGGISKD